METKLLENFAKSARRELIAAVDAQAASVLAPGSIAQTEHAEGIRRLESEIAIHGRKHVIDRVAYTWFNRIIALRFMDAREYTSARIVSPALALQNGQPEILADAKRGHIDVEVVTSATKRLAISGLLDGSRRSTDAEGEAYALLLTEYCRYWNKAMPFMFGGEVDHTELLVPTGLLAEDSVIARAREVLTDEVCDDVEVIGWLYQFYISERKDEVFAGFKKNEKAGSDEIPAATQLFTPHWIVRYLVENSVGRLWQLNRPSSRLIDQMKYYIAPVEEEPDFLKVDSPEELTVIDPAAGSGHMLTYAFDLLYAIYEEEGYAPSEIPARILTHNISGTEIDPRAGALAAFALTMKARAKDRRFFTRGVQPRVIVIEPLSFRQDEITMLTAGKKELTADYIFWNQFEHADIFGSLIRPDAAEVSKVVEVFDEAEAPEDLIYEGTFERAQKFVRQARALSEFYAVVVANPPYMGSKQMNALLSQFMKDEYTDVKQDLYGAFVIRGIDLADRKGHLAIVIGDTWMSIKSFEALRLSLLDGHAFDSFLHLRDVSNHPDIFGANAAFVLSMAGKYTKHAPFVRLTPLGQERKEADLRIALSKRTSDVGFYLATSVDFAEIPGTPIVYWLSEKMRDSFAVGRRLSEVANLRQGLATADNNRFLRQWWEVSTQRTAFSCTSREEAAASGARWFPYNKGGEFRKWYGNQEYVVNWENDGEEIVDFKPRSVIRNPSTYFSSSVSWSDISSGEAAFRRYPAGFIHDSTGHSGFGSEAMLDQITLLLNSKFVMEIMKVVAPTLHFHIGYVGLVPVLDQVDSLSSEALEYLVTSAQEDWDTDETSWNFMENPLVALQSSIVRELH